MNKTNVRFLTGVLSVADQFCNWRNTVKIRPKLRRTKDSLSVEATAIPGQRRAAVFEAESAS